MKKIILLLSILALLCITGASIADGPVAYQEVKLTSSLFNGAVVGKTVVPAGWKVYIKELGLGSESIMWPNALHVIAFSPDESVVLHYISRRDFRERQVTAGSYSTHSDDDAYDKSSMVHTLNYREAGAACDFMVNILFDDSSHTFLYEASKPAGETAFLEKYRQKYLEETESGLSEAIQLLGGKMQLLGVDLTAAERVYQSCSKKTAMAAMTSGFEAYINEPSVAAYDTIDWSINCLYAMQADSALFDQYYDIFTVFRMNTSTTQEYDEMTKLHSQILQNYLMMLQSGKEAPDPTNDMNQATEDTIETGYTYSALEGWSDTIQDRNDYKTSDGLHVKIPTLYDHVYEGDDGTIYAGIGNSLETPYGSTELFPTEVGE